MVGQSTMVRIGSVRLTRVRRVRPAAVRQFTVDGVKPVLFVEVEEAGAEPVITIHPATGITADERWLQVKTIVARREGAPLPAVEFLVDASV